YVLPFTRADALAWGALLASLVRLPNGTQVVKRCRTPLMVAGAVLLGVVAAMREPNWPTWEGAWMQVVGYPGLAMLCSGLVAFVTGSGGGWGRGRVRYLAGKGARVVVNDLSQEAIDRVAAEIIGTGGEAMAIAGSVTDERAMAAMVAQVVADWGRVDILVNNA